MLIIEAYVHIFNYRQQSNIQSLIALHHAGNYFSWIFRFLALHQTQQQPV